MLEWFQKLMPRDEGFFDLFEQHARTIDAGSRALRSILDGRDGVLGFSEEIKRQENKADVITQDTCSMTMPVTRFATSSMIILTR